MQNEFRFTGKRLDVTGFYCFNARYYDPTLGRFISPDPAREGYVSCNNNSLMFVDPDGNDAVPMAFVDAKITIPGTNIKVSGLGLCRQKT